MDVIKEFFGWTADREPEGWFSWQHLVFVTLCTLLTVLLAFWLGKRTKDQSMEKKQKVLRIMAIVMILTELTRIVLTSVRAEDPWFFRGKLPLFLCSINLFVIPLTAFKSKVTKIATYFVAVYGPLCSIAGTYLAGNYYNEWPIISFDVLNSTITHCISGLAGIYMFTSGIMKEYGVLENKRTFFASSLVFLPIAALALIVNFINRGSGYEENYMFLSNSAGTPFSIVEDLTGHIQVLYTIAVIVLYLLYGIVFTNVYYLIEKSRRKKQSA